MPLNIIFKLFILENTKTSITLYNYIQLSQEYIVVFYVAGSSQHFIKENVYVLLIHILMINVDLHIDVFDEGLIIF